jgi:hypothetical protein
MSENTKNQYRCETCNHKEKVKRYTITPHLIECKVAECELTKEDQDFISLVGCTSHSSFVDPNKHLSNLIKHFEAMDDHENLYLCDVIALLKGETKI